MTSPRQKKLDLLILELDSYEMNSLERKEHLRRIEYLAKEIAGKAKKKEIKIVSINKAA